MRLVLVSIPTLIWHCPSSIEITLSVSRMVLLLSDRHPLIYIASSSSCVRLHLFVFPNSVPYLLRSRLRAKSLLLSFSYTNSVAVTLSTFVHHRFFVAISTSLFLYRRFIVALLHCHCLVMDSSSLFTRRYFFVAIPSTLFLPRRLFLTGFVTNYSSPFIHHCLFLSILWPPFHRQIFILANFSLLCLYHLFSSLFHQCCFIIAVPLMPCFSFRRFLVFIS